MAAMSTHEPEQDRVAPPTVRGPRPLAERLRDPDSFGLLLLLILLLLLLSALSGEGPLGQAVVTVVSGAVALFAFWTSRPHARVLRWATVAIALAVIGAILAVFAGSGSALDGGSLAVIAVLTAASPVVVARRLLRHQRVQGSTILGALCIYLLLGLFYAYLFSAIDAVGGPFFAGQPQTIIVDFLYFSYASLTTVGYGDLTAAEDLGRMLAVSEALLGQLYLVTVVALLVGNIGRGRIRPDRG
jgi:drug/metabolite transporter (DMT)-like permease